MYLPVDSLFFHCCTKNLNNIIQFQRETYQTKKNALNSIDMYLHILYIHTSYAYVRTLHENTTSAAKTWVIWRKSLHSEIEIECKYVRCICTSFSSFLFIFFLSYYALAGRQTPAGIDIFNTKHYRQLYFCNYVCIDTYMLGTSIIIELY